MTRQHPVYKAGLACLIYLLLAVGFLGATFFTGIPIEAPAALVFPLYLPFGMDFIVQIIRTSFVSGVHVFVFYLALEWMMATMILSALLWIRTRFLSSTKKPVS